MKSLASRCVVPVIVLGLVFAGCAREEQFSTDPVTPQGAVAALVQAIQAYDHAALPARYVQETDAQKQYVAAMAEMIKSASELRAAAARRFGNEDAKQLMGMDPGGDAIRRFVEAEAKIEGDLATLTASTRQALRLKRQGGQWRVLPPEPADAAKALAVFRHTRGVLQRLTADLDANAESVRQIDAAKRRLHADLQTMPE